jgi:hypothetical protein
MRCSLYSQYLESWVWKVYTSWYRYLSRLHLLKLFILKKEICLFEWPRFLLKSPFYQFFIWSFKIQFFLKLNFVFFFFFYFAFYLITCMRSYLRVLTTSLGFAGALFFSTFFHWFLSWFHYPTFWFLRIDDHYRVVDIFLFFKIQ